MDEAFILKSLEEVGEDKVASVKVCRPFYHTPSVKSWQNILIKNIFR